MFTVCVSCTTYDNTFCCHFDIYIITWESTGPVPNCACIAIKTMKYVLSLRVKNGSEEKLIIYICCSWTDNPCFWKTEHKIVCEFYMYRTLCSFIYFYLWRKDLNIYIQNKQKLVSLADNCCILCLYKRPTNACQPNCIFLSALTDNFHHYGSFGSQTAVLIGGISWKLRYITVFSYFKNARITDYDFQVH